MSSRAATALPNARHVMAEKQRAQAFWLSLSTAERWQIGDELVLGDLDVWAWFDGKSPSQTFLEELDHLRILWECAQ